MKFWEFRNEIKPEAKIELYLSDGTSIEVTADGYAPIWVLNREVVKSECISDTIKIYLQNVD